MTGRKRRHTAAKEAGITSVGCNRTLLNVLHGICTDVRKKYGRSIQPREVLNVVVQFGGLLKAIARADAEGTGYHVDLHFVLLAPGGARTICYSDEKTPAVPRSAASPIKGGASKAILSSKAAPDPGCSSQMQLPLA
jgi:hypothetical protein